MFKVVMIYPDGTREEEDEVFETEAEAREYGDEQVNNFASGAEVLELAGRSYDDRDADYEVIVVED